MSFRQYFISFCLAVSCIEMTGCALTRDGDQKVVNPDVKEGGLSTPADVAEPVPDVTAPESTSSGLEVVTTKKLVAPQAFKATVVRMSTTGECEPSQAPYTGDLVFPSKYEGSDASRDTLNPEAEQKYLELTADFKSLETLVSSWSDRYLEGDLEARDCALSMLEQWAISNALLTDSINEMGQSVRKWALATMAISYLKMTQANSTPPMPTRLSIISKSIIENWLVMVAEDVRKHYSDRPIEKVNNHDYWAAWAVMATAVVSNREDLFNWSLEKFHLGISQIDDQGYLPNELKRETRALSYHNFALQPLVWMAVFSEANGRGLNDAQFRALSKLATNTITGLRNPAIFSDLTGYEQYVDGLDTSYSLAWIEVWASTFPELKRMSENLVRLRPMKSTRLGGNVSLLFKGPDLASKRIQKRKDK